MNAFNPTFHTTPAHAAPTAPGDDVAALVTQIAVPAPPSTTPRAPARAKGKWNRPEPLHAKHVTVVGTRDADYAFSKSRVRVEKENFYGGDGPKEAFLIVGFDTEFKTPKAAVSRDDIKEGRASYEVLSYQTWCRLYDCEQPQAREWGGIAYPAEAGTRLTLADVLTYTIHKGIAEGAIEKIPEKIFFVGHFDRADVPAFADFNELADYLSCVRGCLVSTDENTPITFAFDDADPVTVKVLFRDTSLLTPTASKGLAALGDLVGVEKVVLHPDRHEEQRLKENMDELLAEQPALFERYALTDAKICVRYMEQLLELVVECTGRLYVPVTLTAIGVELLLETWKEGGVDVLAVLGKEAVRDTRWNKRLSRYFSSSEKVDLEEVHFHVDLATACYHGGRGEQFWFGPGFEDVWTDYDLSGAYRKVGPASSLCPAKLGWSRVARSGRI